MKVLQTPFQLRFLSGGVLVVMALLLGTTSAISDNGNKVPKEEIVAHRVRRAESIPYSDNDKKVMLDMHNKYRSMAKAADMMLMEWDDDLEKEAQRWADRCDFQHPKAKRAVGRFEVIGQNLFVSTVDRNTSVPMESWYNEIEFYTYATRKCQKDQMCGHYTQVIWANTTAVGCAIQKCDLVTTANFSPGYLVVCEYGPAGNYIGRYPYFKGKVCSKCPETHKFCVSNMCSTVEGSSDSNSGGSDSDSDSDSDSESVALRPVPHAANLLIQQVVSWAVVATIATANPIQLLFLS